jgi:hypothetical protein
MAQNKSQQLADLRQQIEKAHEALDMMGVSRRTSDDELSLEKRIIMIMETLMEMGISFHLNPPFGRHPDYERRTLDRILGEDAMFMERLNSRPRARRTRTRRNPV